MSGRQIRRINSHVDSNGTVDIRAHAGNPHEDLSGRSHSWLDCADLRVVNHVVQLGVLVENDTSSRDGLPFSNSEKNDLTVQSSTTFAKVPQRTSSSA